MWWREAAGTPASKAGTEEEPITPRKKTSKPQCSSWPNRLLLLPLVASQDTQTRSGPLTGIWVWSSLLRPDCASCAGNLSHQGRPAGRGRIQGSACVRPRGEGCDCGRPPLAASRGFWDRPTLALTSHVCCRHLSRCQDGGRRWRGGRCWGWWRGGCCSPAPSQHPAAYKAGKCEQLQDDVVTEVSRGCS